MVSLYALDATGAALGDAPTVVVSLDALDATGAALGDVPTGEYDAAVDALGDAAGAALGDVIDVHVFATHMFGDEQSLSS